MNEIFRHMLNQFVIIYIDDILIYLLNLEEHKQYVSQVLQSIREHHLYFKQGCSLSMWVLLQVDVPGRTKL